MLYCICRTNPKIQQIGRRRACLLHICNVWIKGRYFKDHRPPHDLYWHTHEGHRIIIAEPFIAPGRFFVLDYNPSEELLQKMKHGLYTKGDLSNMENLQYDCNVRAAFEDYDKPRISDFLKHHQYATLGVLSVLAFVLSFLGDKLFRRSGVFFVYLLWQNVQALRPLRFLFWPFHLYLHLEAWFQKKSGWNAQ